ncbi:MAG TPA: lamin tail domain-containing protein [Saprospiraceae bacterium]|nr:lamin tail domain-containing protein [Saprospiraceae bacterium]
MKKTILTFSCFLTFLLSTRAQIVITEIMYNPPESGIDSLEFIEVLNHSNAAVNMTDWKLEFGTFSFVVPALNLGAGQYQIFSVNAAAIQNNFNKPSIQWTDGALSNNGTSVRIKNAAGALIDSLTYDDATPWPTEPDGNGASLVLCDPDSDNTLPASWKAAITPTGVTINAIPVLANPGAASGCSNVLNAKADDFLVLLNTTTALNVLANDDIPDPANITVSIIEPPLAGSATVNPDNSINYQPNTNYCGGDGFLYQICDPNACDTALVLISIPCYPARTIAEVTTEDFDGVADSLGVYCELTGYVYGVNTRASTIGIQFTLIDGANFAGINVFNPTGNVGYTVKEGDQIKVRGFIDIFNGLTEIFAQQITLVSGNNSLAAPELVTKPSENTESRLIQIKNLHLVDNAQWTTGVGAGFTVQAISDVNPLDTILVRIDNDVDLFNQPVPPQPFNLTGIGGQFDATFPYLSDYQIAPRYIPDVSTLVGTKEADFSSHVRLTPNPVSDRLLLQTDLQFDRVRIFNALGVLCIAMDNPAPSQPVQVGALPNGMYFIQFEKDNAAWTTRFVKQ